MGARALLCIDQNSSELCTLFGQPADVAQSLCQMNDVLPPPLCYRIGISTHLYNHSVHQCPAYKLGPQAASAPAFQAQFASSARPWVEYLYLQK